MVVVFAAASKHACLIIEAVVLSGCRAYTGTKFFPTSTIALFQIDRCLLARSIASHNDLDGMPVEWSCLYFIWWQLVFRGLCVASFTAFV